MTSVKLGVLTLLIIVLLGANVWQYVKSQQSYQLPKATWQQVDEYTFKCLFCEEN